MAEFTPIESQEELDRIINERLKREKETSAKKYEGWLSPDDQKKASAELQKQADDLTKSLESQTKKYANYDKELADKEAKIKEYETGSVKTRIALATGLPYDMASRLRGETEEEIQKDADSMKALMGSTKPVAPLANPEGDPSSKSSSEVAMKEMLHKMKGE
jgi:hypothetical protein